MSAASPAHDDVERARDRWLGDFSLVLKPDSIRSFARSPDYEAFTGSKLAAFPPLVLIALVAGALGGIATSSSLWSRLWPVPLWLAAMILFVLAVHRFSRARFRPPIGFLAGWSLFFGFLMGAFTLWGAQLDSAAWCYGIAGGLVFFLVGITGGNIEPPNSKGMEDWFLTGAVMAPVGGCAGAWIYRNLLPDPDSLLSAAFIGALAALPFLGVTMALHLLAWRPERGIGRLASLYLHNDAFAGEAAALFDSALKAEPDNPVLLARRGLARALAGDRPAAESDWSEVRRLDPESNLGGIARGWAELRLGDPESALASFQSALPPKRRDRHALVGTALAQARIADDRASLEALKRVPGKAHDSLSLTYLAEAYLRTGDAPSALSSATAAIEEADSIHGRSWIVRAEAQRALGRIDAAAEDYNRALWASDEIGVEELALAGLAEIDRPVTEDEPDW